MSSPIGNSPLTSAATTRTSSLLGHAARAALVALALWVFLVALATLRDGAGQIAPQLRGSAFTDSSASALGLGWGTALVVMSGSPVAVGALALLDAGTVSTREAFAILVGSRLGASCVVLLVASAYAIGGKTLPGGRRGALGIGLLAVVLTFSIYLPGSLLGYWMLDHGLLDAARPKAPDGMLDLIAASTGWAVAAVDTIMPHGWLIAAGAALILLSVRLLDRALPDLDPDRLARASSWQSRKWVMLAVGGAVALLTMSVSVALTLLVPAVAKGYLRREHAVAYILGANVTTLGDTLLSALLLGNSLAAQVVIAELVGVGLMTLLVVAVGFEHLRGGSLALCDWLLARPVRMIPATALLVASPVLLIVAF